MTDFPQLCIITNRYVTSCYNINGADKLVVGLVAGNGGSVNVDYSGSGEGVSGGSGGGRVSGGVCADASSASGGNGDGDSASSGHCCGAGDR